MAAAVGGCYGRASHGAQSRPAQLAERLYLPEIVRGVAVTTGHFVRNMALHTLHLFGLARDRPAMVTVQYPEQRKVYSRGLPGSRIG